MIKCNQCGHQCPVDECHASMSIYHDMKCPKCDTTDLDTSELNKEWAERGEKYGYGDDNFLKM